MAEIVQISHYIPAAPDVNILHKYSRMVRTRKLIWVPHCYLKILLQFHQFFQDCRPSVPDPSWDPTLPLVATSP